MTGYEYFEQVLKSKGLKPFDVSKGTKIRSGVFSDWKAGRYTPKADELITLDDYKHDLAAYKADIDTFKAEARKYRVRIKKPSTTS